MNSRLWIRSGLWLTLMMIMMTPALAQDDYGGGQIAFNCFINQQTGICVANPDGSGFLQLILMDSFISDLRFSRDGTQIAFTAAPNSHDGYSSEIYVMQADGGNLHRITYLEGQIWGLDWSPDDTEIVFSVTFPDALWDIYSMDLEAGIVYPFIDHGGGERYPHWSPDGSHLLFTTFNELWLTDPAASSVIQLTDNEMLEETSSWSPDGSQIAFSASLDVNSSLDIFVMDADGGNVRQLTDTPDQEWVRGWSPDGQYILFSAYGSEEPSQLYLLNLDDGSIHPLLEEDAGVAQAYTGDWSATARVTTVAPPITASENVPNGLWMETWNYAGERLCRNNEQRRTFRNQPFLLIVAEDGSEMALYYLLTGEAVDLSRSSPDFYVSSQPNTTDEAYGEVHVVSLNHIELAFFETVNDQCSIFNSALWDFVTDGAYCTLTALGTPNLRSGPGTTFQQVGALSAGEDTIAITQATGEDGYVWYQLYDNKWVRSDLVESESTCADLPSQ